MKVGYEVQLEGDVWECICGGKDVCVFQKKQKLIKKPSISYKPTKSKKEDVYYLEFITTDDILPLVEYLNEENIKYRNVDLYYIFIHYCKLRVKDVADVLKTKKSSISGSEAYIQNSSSLDKTDELARSVGYWKYKRLNEK